jgi:NAD(P)-dependent dehydrogenase (short-subunit alcohol dehydrogenase family)
MMLDPFPLKNRTALVTGSGKNIGKAIAKLFAEAGARVIVNGHRDRNAVDGTVEEIREAGGSAIGIMADVSDPADMRRMVDEANAAFGAIDIAVSNVSWRLRQRFLDISIEDWQKVINVNLNSAFYLDRCVLPQMTERRWGRIIHISGVDGFSTAVTTRAHNIVCKQGVHTLAKVLALEFGPFGITANTVAPGPTDTTRDWQHYPPDFVEEERKTIPVGRLGKVEEIAQACLFLAGDSGAFVNGQVLHVNGGQHRF